MTILHEPRSPSLAALLCCCSGTLYAQEVLPPAQLAPACAIVDNASVWRVPIHTQAPDAVGGVYGHWAAGDDYKVSFHDGFTFYPYVGAASANRPLRWVTEGVTAGGEPVTDVGEAQHAHTDWRYEYRYAAVTEAYDVRADGVEQLFVLRERPARGGDLVVAGRFVTELRPSRPAMTAEHAEIVFVDGEQQPLVRYGKAVAFDATGRRTAVTTSLDGLRVHLRVPGGWLADAVYPVTIDPLTSRIQVSFNGRADFTAVHHEDESATHNTMTSYSRQFSATDYDLYTRLNDADLGNSVQVFTDVTANWSTVFPDVTFVGGADRWLIAFWRHFTTGQTRVRVQFHDKGNTTLNSGTIASHDPSASEHDSFPALGGRSNPSSGTTALMTYRADPIYGNSPTSVIWGVMIDAQNRTIGTTRFQISRPNLDAEAPDVNSQIGWYDDGWVVVYEGTNGAPDDYDVYVRRVSSSGALFGDVFVGPDPGGDKTRPVVEGWDGRYLVAMLADPAPESGGQRWARNIWTERFDWTSSMPLPQKRGPRQLLANPNQDVSHLRVGYDGITFSHWCLVYQADSVASPVCYCKRLGYTGGVTESAVLDQGAAGRYHPAVAWNAQAREFPIIYCSTEATQPVYAQRLQYRSDAINVPYGLGCTPNLYNFGADLPLAGSQFFAMHFNGLPAGRILIVGLSLGSASIPLDSAGMPGCTLLVNPNAPAYVGTMLVITGSGGTDIPLALPDRPLFQQNLYAQCFWLAQGTNPMNVVATRGLRMQVR